MNQTITYLLFFALGVVITAAIYANIILFSEPNVVSLSEHANYSARMAVRSVPIVAVSSLDNDGVMGELEVKLIPGNSNVLIDLNPFSRTDLQYSSNLAVTVAKLQAENYAPHHDFIFTYNAQSPVVGGQSAGAATTVAVLAALEDKEINDGVVLTGTIRQDGTIGQVGGILEKAKAVADAGYEVFLVPSGQSTITYYERVVEEEPVDGFVIRNQRFVPQVVDLDEEWDLRIIEVRDIEEAADYMLE